MALEAVVYPQDPFGYANPYKDFLFYQFHEDKTLLDNFLEPNSHSTTSTEKGSCDRHSDHQLLHASNSWEFNVNYANSSSVSPDQTFSTNGQDHSEYHALPRPAEGLVQVMEPHPGPSSPPPPANRRKRRRTRSSKNKEEIENQRMTHIAVERNRRKQMNEYLAVLRSLMPPSYVQRGDQASIIGGAINFVKELEQLLQSMEAYKKTSSATSASKSEQRENNTPFADFFAFPQYSARSTHRGNSPAAESLATSVAGDGVAEIEVSMVESHANLKILSKKRQRQLLKLVHGLQSLSLTILHLNVTTTIDHLVLYSLSLKVEEGCLLNTVDDIAGAANQMLRKIEEEAAFS